LARSVVGLGFWVLCVFDFICNGWPPLYIGHSRVPRNGEKQGKVGRGSEGGAEEAARMAKQTRRCEQRKKLKEVDQERKMLRGKHKCCSADPQGVEDGLDFIDDFLANSDSDIRVGSKIIQLQMNESTLTDWKNQGAGGPCWRPDASNRSINRRVTMDEQEEALATTQTATFLKPGTGLSTMTFTAEVADGWHNN
jgi:hypothetical protein